MIEIVPQDPVVKRIIGTQQVSNREYNWSQYVIKKICDDGILLYHTLSCELLLLKADEREEYSHKYLIENWFLVTLEFDEFEFAKKVKKLRQLLYRTESDKPIERYWILTTTDCNARCFYCHEKGIPLQEMTKETAIKVVEYIKTTSPQTEIEVVWYGGEPLLGKETINIICDALKENGVTYTSKSISNGYLFDKDVVKQAREMWHLKEIQITLDGLEQTYNRVKNYKDTESESPFWRVINNIELLLKNEIQVIVRLNVDEYNKDELGYLSKLLIDRFCHYHAFSIYTAPLFEDCLGTTKKRTEQERIKVYNVHHELSDWLNRNGVLTKTKLAKRMKSARNCIAVSNTRVIFPDGQLAFCHDYVKGVLSGNIYGEAPDAEKRLEYTECLPEKAECARCVKYPQCVRLSKCFNNKCNKQLLEDWIWSVQNEMAWEYEAWCQDI